MRRKPDPDEQEFRDRQVCVFVCGQCDYTFTGELGDWLADREAHRFAAHPDFKPKRKPGPTPPRQLSEREMKQGIAA